MSIEIMHDLIYENYELWWTFDMDFMTLKLRFYLNIDGLILNWFYSSCLLLNSMILNKYHVPTKCWIKLHNKNSQVIFDDLLHNFTTLGCWWVIEFLC